MGRNDVKPSGTWIWTELLIDRRGHDDRRASCCRVVPLRRLCFEALPAARRLGPRLAVMDERKAKKERARLHSLARAGLGWSERPSPTRYGRLLRARDPRRICCGVRPRRSHGPPTNHPDTNRLAPGPKSCLASAISAYLVC